MALATTPLVVHRRSLMASVASLSEAAANTLGRGIDCILLWFGRGVAGLCKMDNLLNVSI